MEYTSEQLQMLRQPFEKAGAFAGRSEEEIKKLLKEVADILITLSEINLLSKQNKN